MNDKTKKLTELDSRYVWHPFTQMSQWLSSEPVIIDSAEGFYLIDTKGNRYIDGVSSLWCNVHGHRVEYIDNAIRDQLNKVAHSTLLGLGQTASIELAEKLVKITPANLTKVFYSDSGATSVEIALKIAYQYYHNQGDTKRTKFISLQNSYHGDTIGSVSLGGIDTFHSIFLPLLFKTFFVPAPHPYRFEGTESQCAQNTLDAIENFLKQYPDQVAAVVVEPLVQGAGGMIVHPRGFLKDLAQLAKKHDTLLITDEVATGFGKTGKMFACEIEDVQPDIMCLAKGITGGYLPLAATLTTQQIFDAFLGKIEENKTFYHGHTYTGNALACTAAIASLELFKKNRVIESMQEKIDLINSYFERFASLPNVGNARQVGIAGAVEIVKDKKTKESFPHQMTIGAKLCEATRPDGAMLRPLSDCIILMPPVAIDVPTLEKLLKIIANALENKLPKIIDSITSQGQ